MATVGFVAAFVGHPAFEWRFGGVVAEVPVALGVLVAILAVPAPLLGLVRDRHRRAVRA